MNEFFKAPAALRMAAISLLIPCAGFLCAIGIALSKPETPHLEFRPLPPVEIELPGVNLELSGEESE